MAEIQEIRRSAILDLDAKIKKRIFCKLSNLELRCLLVDDLTAIGSAALVVLATAGSTNSVRTINAYLLTYGEQPSGVVILERRYSPRRLRDDDDDDDDGIY